MGHFALVALRGAAGFFGAAAGFVSEASGTGVM